MEKDSVQIWPFKSADQKAKDRAVQLPDPIVDKGKGLWHVSADDIECLGIGCGILGSGGGGNPKIGKNVALNLWNEGKHLKIYHPYVNQIAAPKSMLCTVALIGKAHAVKDNEIDATSATYAVRLVRQALASGVCDPKSGGGITGNSKVKVTKETMPDGSVVCLADVEDLKKIDLESCSPDQDHNIVGLFSTEIGGVNTMVPLQVEGGLIFIDADCQGRAFPKLGMLMPFVDGIKPYPSTICDSDGQKMYCCTHIESADTLEEFFRQKSIDMGDITATSLAVMSYKDVIKMCIPFALSHTWQIGRTIIRATRMKQDPVEALLREEKRGSLVIISGRITDIKVEVDPGFDSKKIILSGNDKYAGHMVEVRVQNEIYAALSCDEKKMYACAPDIISMVDPNTGIPTTATDPNLLGSVVSLICLLCDPKLKTPKALIHVGPRAYKDLVDLGFSKYKPPSSVL